jgi:hypothetical protein
MLVQKLRDDSTMVDRWQSMAAPVPTQGPRPGNTTSQSNALTFELTVTRVGSISATSL